jgi:hypothetical protein
MQHLPLDVTNKYTAPLPSVFQSLGPLGSLDALLWSCSIIRRRAPETHILRINGMINLVDSVESAWPSCQLPSLTSNDISTLSFLSQCAIAAVLLYHPSPLAEFFEFGRMSTARLSACGICRASI